MTLYCDMDIQIYIYNHDKIESMALKILNLALTVHPYHYLLTLFCVPSSTDFLLMYNHDFEA